MMSLKLSRKKWFRPSLRTVLGVLLVVPLSAYAVNWNQIAHWSMDGGSGQSTMIDWWGESNDGRLLDSRQVTSGRLGGWAWRFRGTNKNSRVVIDNQSGMSPGTKDFLVRARIRFTSELPYQASWNFAQRGRADNIGGQWKLELARSKQSSGGKVSFRCLFRRPGAPSEPLTVQVLDRGSSLQKNMTYDVSCRLNRSSTNASVTAGVNNTATNRWTWASKSSGIRNVIFGSINPRGNSCALGNVTTIGGKAYCANENPDQSELREDMYKGYLLWMKVWKGR